MMRRGRSRRKGLSFTAIIGMCFLAILVGFVMGNLMIQSMERSSGPQEGMDVITEEDLLEESLDEMDYPVGIDEVGEVADPYLEDVEPQLYRVQVGDFEDRDGALGLKEELRGQGYVPHITAGRPYRVQVGAFGERRNAEKLALELREQDYEVMIVD